MNLYAHFPFCRSKCAYCALHSRAGSTPAARAAYCAALARACADALAARGGAALDTVYFGGGSPALCDLAPLFRALAPALTADTEFTVELHPHDAAPAVLAALRAGGVNRVSLGVQSLDDAALAAMRRGHTADEAERAFAAVRAAGFANAGIDLIAGWPGTSDASWRRTLARAAALGPDHASVYSLIREERTLLDRAVRAGRVTLPPDDAALAQIDAARGVLARAGLARYEISSYARPGRECRHNLAVWRGEDYIGLGEGAHGRLGRARTENGAVTATLDAEQDALERALFSLRTSDGLDLDRVARLWPALVPRLPAWRDVLDFNVSLGFLTRCPPARYVLTPRGAEVCDSILCDLV